MSLWIQVDANLPGHRKTHRLADLLAAGAADLFGGSRVTWRARAVVLLIDFWAYVGEHHPDGDLTHAHPESIKDAIRPWLEATEWLSKDVRDLLADSGHLDRREGGRLVVHGWREWSGAELLRLAKDRKRKRLDRGKRPRTGQDVPRTVPGQKPLEGKERPHPAEPGNPKGRAAPGAPAEAWLSELHDDHRGAVEGLVRAAQSPRTVLAAIRATGPGGTAERRGVTWPIVGRACFELVAAGGGFTPARLDAFIRRLLAAPPDNGTGEVTFADQVGQEARRQREREAEAKRR